MPNIDIRLVEPAYESEIRALSQQTQAQHQARLPHIFYDEGAEQSKVLDILFGENPPKTICAFMAVERETLAGYVLLLLTEEPSGDEINTLIADICVVEGFRQQGVGIDLLKYCEAEKERQGWESLHAQVWQGNDASHALFKAAGYVSEHTEYRLGVPSAPNTSNVPTDPSPTSIESWLTPVALAILVVAAILVGALT